MTIVINSKMDGPDADALRLALLDALRPDAVVALDIDETGDPTFAFLQVIEAARCQAQAVGAQLSLVRPAGGALLAALDHAGLLDAARHHAPQFWTLGAPLA